MKSRVDRRNNADISSAFGLEEKLKEVTNEKEKLET
jgi:hypothetical protein